MNNLSWGNSPNAYFFALISTVALASAGCAVDSADAEVSSSAISATDVRSEATLNATWRYLDRIGRGVVKDTEASGLIRIELIGAPLPVAGSAIPLQTATLTLTLPDFERPSRIVQRRFFIHYEVVEQADGTTRYNVTPYSHASVVDADVPNASAKFAATYDPATQKAKEYFAFSGDISMGMLGFQADAAGNLRPQSEFWIGTSPRVKSDFAYHNYLVSLKD